MMTLFLHMTKPQSSDRKKMIAKKDLERFFGFKGCVISKLISECKKLLVNRVCITTEISYKRDHLGKFQHFRDIFGNVLNFLNRSFKISRRLCKQQKPKNIFSDMLCNELK